MPTWTRSLVPLAVVAAVAGASSCSAPPAHDGTAAPASTTTAPASTPSAPLAPRPSSATTTSADASEPADLTGPAPRLPDDPASPATTDAPPRASGDDVLPVIAWAGVDGDRVVVNAYVPVLEQGGACTLVLTHGTDAAEVTAAAEPDAEVTWCAPLEIAVTDLRSGAWEARVGYAGSGSGKAGSSAVTTVSVP
ncbi:hypothetical protein [Cellulosimicrobium sp. NPDC057862]|uniref:hypothetical protein n=1 Tax=Cellulosimicrobium sp. NPDC057862 TaxID=3346266 RepID=UPI003672D8FA